jgi:hypothetical protein
MIAMDATPVWLLDIDGVVNVITEAPDSTVWPAKAWVRAEATCAGSPWPLLAARPVLDLIRRVHRAGLAEIRWHTTWQEGAIGVGAALGLPPFPVEPCPWFGDRWWKLIAVERVLSQGRPLLWTDDDAERRLGDEGYELPMSPDALIVSPRSSDGLTAAHLRRIAAFLKSRQPVKAWSRPARWAAGRRARQESAPS